MKRIMIFAAALALLLTPLAAVCSFAEAPAGTTFNVYTEKMAKDNHYAPSGWMGDYGDMMMSEGCAENPHSGKTCMKIAYSARGSNNAWWVGIYWQNPSNNWGDQVGGYDLTGYKKLTFWVRGEKGGEVITEFRIGGISGKHSDSDSITVGPIILTKDWKQYSINLAGLDLSYISGGFEFTATAKENPEGFVMYLDDIRYEK
jgi:hypothetical protein